MDPFFVFFFFDLSDNGYDHMHVVRHNDKFSQNDIRSQLKEVTKKCST